MTADKASKKSPGRDELVLAALGGLGEIGMNCYLYGLGPPADRRWLMVDLGITFPGPSEPGVDVVLPDLKFIVGQKEKLAGILLTHAHEDHLGAVLDLWPRLGVPIYATPFTAGMLNAKNAENGGRLKLPIKVVKLGQRFKIDPFDIELVTMAHSIPEPSAVVIRTPVGTLVHTGDWKLDKDPYVGDPSDEARLQALGEEGVLAVVCDSTNAFREGRSPSEAEVARSLTDIIKKAKRRVAVTSFASNVARLKAVADAAKASGRHLVVAGRSMHRIIEVAKDTGYLPEDFTYLDQDQFGYLEPDEVLALCTGSQGEARAALARIAEDEHPQVSLATGDLVIFSSRPIPGNEKAIARVQNGLAKLGCDIVTDSDALVHVTGHPRRDELRQLYAWLKPKVAIPMHGEPRHLREHRKLAHAAGVPEAHAVADGQMIRVAPAPVMIVQEFHTGRLYRDGRLVVPSEDGPVRERRKLSFVGIVVVAVTIDRKGGLVSDIEAELDGVPTDTDGGRPMIDVVLSAAEGTIDSIPRERRRDAERVREAVRRAVRSAVEQIWGKRPVVKVLMQIID